MNENKFKYIFGPVSSWRLGRSLGIDLLSGEKKLCNFNCLYCQLGDTENFQRKREVFVETDKIIDEISQLPKIKIDYYTFSSRGEPTLALNLGEAIIKVKEKTKGRVAVITNASLIGDQQVRDDLSHADFVMVKLDVPDEENLKVVNNPSDDIDIDKIINGIKFFKKDFQGKLALQIMFVEENLHLVDKIAEIAKDISPDEIQVNTPTRKSKVSPVEKRKIDEIKKHFSFLPTVCVYDGEKQDVVSLDDKSTFLRHGSE